VSGLPGPRQRVLEPGGVAGAGGGLLAGRFPEGERKGFCFIFPPSSRVSQWR